MRRSLVLLSVLVFFVFACRYAPMARSLDQIMEYPADGSQKDGPAAKGGPSPSPVFKEQSSRPADAAEKIVGASPAGERGSENPIAPKTVRRARRARNVLDPGEVHNTASVGRGHHDGGRIVFHEDFEGDVAEVFSRWRLLTDQTVDDPDTLQKRLAGAGDVMNFSNRAKSGKRALRMDTPFELTTAFADMHGALEVSFYDALSEGALIFTVNANPESQVVFGVGGEFGTYGWRMGTCDVGFADDGTRFPREKGWHKFRLDASSGTGATIELDGKPFAELPGRSAMLSSFTMRAQGGGADGFLVDDVTVTKLGPTSGIGFSRIEQGGVFAEGENVSFELVRARSSVTPPAVRLYCESYDNPLENRTIRIEPPRVRPDEEVKFRVNLGPDFSRGAWRMALLPSASDTVAAVGNFTVVGRTLQVERSAAEIEGRMRRMMREVDRVQCHVAMLGDGRHEYRESRFEGGKIRDAGFGKFLEVGAAPGAGVRRDAGWFAVGMKVENPGRPHVLEIEYPNDRARAFSVCVSSDRARECFGVRLAATPSSMAIVTGEDLPVSRQFEKARMIVWPRRNELCVTVASLGNPDRYGYRDPQASQQAAARYLTLYELEADLPALKKERFAGGGRGVIFSAPKVEALLPSFASLSDALVPADACAGAFNVANSLMNRGTFVASPRVQYGWFVAAENLVRYLKYRGDTGLDLPVVRDDLCGFGTTTLAQRFDAERMLAKMLSINDMEFIPRIRISTPDVLAGFEPGDMQLKNGLFPENDFFVVTRYGELARDAAGRPVLNPLHPLVRELYVQAVRRTAARFADMRGVWRIAVDLGEFFGPVWRTSDPELWTNPELMPDETGFGDYTYSYLAKKGVNLRIDARDPQRFGKRYAAISASRAYSRALRDLKCEAVTTLVAQMRDACREGGLKKLELRIDAPSGEHVARHLAEVGREASLLGVLKDFGIDMAALAGLEHVIVSPSFDPTRHRLVNLDPAPEVAFKTGAQSRFKPSMGQSRDAWSALRFMADGEFRGLFRPEDGSLNVVASQRTLHAATGDKNWFFVAPNDEYETLLAKLEQLVTNADFKRAAMGEYAAIGVAGYNSEKQREQIRRLIGDLEATGGFLFRRHVAPVSGPDARAWMLAHAYATCAPRDVVISFRKGGLPLGSDDAHRRFAEAFRLIPRSARMTLLGRLDGPVTMRGAGSEKTTVVSLTNRTAAEQNFTLEIVSRVKPKIVELVSGETVKIENDIAVFTLAPYSTKVIEADQPGLVLNGIEVPRTFGPPAPHGGD